MSLKNEHSHTNNDFEAVRAHALLNVKTGSAETVGLTLVGDVAGLWFGEVYSLWSCLWSGSPGQRGNSLV